MSLVRVAVAVAAPFTHTIASAITATMEERSRGCELVSRESSDQARGGPREERGAKTRARGDVVCAIVYVDRVANDSFAIGSSVRGRIAAPSA